MSIDPYTYPLLETDTADNIAKAVVSIAKHDPDGLTIVRKAFADVMSGLEALSMYDHDLLYMFYDKEALILKEASAYGYDVVTALSAEGKR